MTNRKKIPQDYQDLARSKGFEWLGPEVPNNKTKTWWRCQYGHVWESRFDNITSGYGCPACAGRVPKTPEDFRNLAKTKGFLWIGTEICATNDATDWLCKEGHAWRTSFNHILEGTGCPKCRNKENGDRFRLKSEDYHELAKKRGFVWLGPEVPGNDIKTEWQCQKQHRWMARFGNISSGKGCPLCYIDRHYKKPEDYHDLAKKHGFIWLGPEVSTTKDKTVWQCGNHTWETSYSKVQERKPMTGCPNCPKIKRKRATKGR